MKESSADPTIYEVLVEEHAEVSERLDELASEPDIERREELFEEVLYQLERHTQAEEAVFYEVLAQHEDTRALADGAVKDHGEMRRLLGALDGMEADDPRWDEVVADLKRVVAEHVATEEQQIFAAVRQRIDDDQARTLAETFEAMELRVEEAEEEDDERSPGAAA